MKHKHILSAFLSLVMAASAVLPCYAGAAQAAGSIPVTRTADVSEGMEITSTNAFGSLLTSEIEEQAAADSQALWNSGAQITELSIAETTANVRFTSPVDASLFVGIYDEDGTQLLCSGTADVRASEDTAAVQIETASLPEYFLVKAYLIDPVLHAPLCEVYENSLYTQSWQEFFRKTTDDFPEERVLNFDDDNTNNFAVIREGITVIPAEPGANAVLSADESTQTYVIGHPSDALLSVQPGERIAYAYGEDGLLLIEADVLTAQEDTLTIEGSPINGDDFFEYIRLEADQTTADLSDAELADGWEYVEENAQTVDPLYPVAGAVDDTEMEVDHPVGTGFEFKFKDWEYPPKDKNKDTAVSGKRVTTSGSVKVDGSVSASAYAHLRWYKNERESYLECKTTLSLEAELTFSGEVEITLHLFRKAPSYPLGYGISFTLDPSIVFKVGGELSFKGSHEVSYGFKRTRMEGVPAKLEKISDTPKPEIEASLEGTVFVGVDLKPGVKFLDDEWLSVKLNGTVGVECKAAKSMEYSELIDDTPDPLELSSVHTCKVCIEGTINFKVDLSITTTELVVLKQSVKLFSYSHKIGDFYFSADNLEFGWGLCPHHVYKVNLRFLDGRTLDPLPGVKVTFPENTAYTPQSKHTITPVTTLETDSNGIVTLWTKPGQLNYSAVLPGYKHIESKSYVERLADDSIQITNPYTQGLAKDYASEYLFPGDDTAQVLVQDSFGNGIPFAVLTEPVETFSKVSAACYHTDKFGEVLVYGTSGEHTFRVEATGFRTADVTVQIGAVERTVVTLSYEQDIKIEEPTEEPMEEPTESIEATGTCGENLTWKIVNGVLTISGTGEMDNYSSRAPWYYYDSAETVIIENGVTSIGNNAFHHCRKLTSISIPDSVITLGEKAFAECDTLTSITIPDSVTSIGEKAFYRCYSLTSITIGSGVTSIAASAFSDCESLTSIAIPDSVTSIGESAFARCYSLTSITIGSGVTSIADDTFEFCRNLTSITIPDSVTSIGNAAFLGSGLTSITIPDNVTDIGNDAFNACSNLEDVTFGSGISIGYEAFYDTPWLKNRSAENPLVIVNDILLDGVAYTDESLQIPSNVTKIAGHAFCWNNNLTSVTIPNSVSYIGVGAFANCENLVSITIPESVTTIRSAAFAYTGLTSINLPSGITSIDDLTFLSCTELTSITIPDGVTRIGVGAFEYCGQLTSINVPESVTSIKNRAFDNTPWLSTKMEESTLVYVNNVLLDGTGYEGDLVIPDNIVSIADGAFSINANLTSVTLPESLASIGASAFYKCTGLTSITILNPDCEIYDDKGTICAFCESLWSSFNGTIYGYEGSTAQDYAEKYYYKFQAINPATQSKPRPVTAQQIGAPAQTVQTFTELLPDTLYNFYSVRTDLTADFLSADNVLYLSQGTSDSEGNLSFSYTPRFDDSDAVKLAVPVKQSMQNVSVILGDMTYTGEALTLRPEVIWGTKTLQEGTDYTLSGDVTVNAPGYYTLTFDGLGSFTDSLTVGYLVYSDVQYILGDVNEDTAVNANDASRILLAAAKIGAKRTSGLTENQELAADVNSDGRINAVDASIVLRYAAAIGAKIEGITLLDFV